MSGSSKDKAQKTHNGGRERAGSLEATCWNGENLLGLPPAMTVTVTGKAVTGLVAAFFPATQEITYVHSVDGLS